MEVENLPLYCFFCGKFRHADVDCFRKDPSLRPPKQIQEPSSKALKVQQKFVPKATLVKGKKKAIELDGGLVLLPSSKVIQFTSGDATISDTQQIGNLM